ncbi:MAG: SDR family NAD(P)-dependent oxidoreductase [Bacilli bacterium]|nr:SDR family NAD(P)-dependent oxidoreductase [Bacilli bacterium]
MKRVILTGANDGLGASFGELCIKNGIEIVALGRHKPNYECEFVEVDLRNEEQIENAIEEVKNKYSEFDAFINCAGAMSLGKLRDISLSEAKDVFMVNSIAPIYLVSKLHDVIVKNKADILNVVSIMATLFDIELDSVLYTGSKWGFKGASYNLEAEFSKTPCRVITLNPGGMNTNLFRKYDKSLENMADEWMNPKDIADIMLYILNLPKQVEVSEITITRKANYKD